MSTQSESRFDWSDPLLLEQQLTHEEQMVRDTARSYAQDKLMPRVLDAYRNEKFDRAIITEMGQLGLLGPTVPEEYGGAGLGYIAFAWPCARSSASTPAIARR